MDTWLYTLMVCGAISSIVGVLYSSLRAFLRSRAERRLTRLVQARLKSLDNAFGSSAASGTNFSDFSPKELEAFHQILERKLPDFDERERKLLAEGLEQSSKTGRIEYTRKLLEESKREFARSSA